MRGVLLWERMKVNNNMNIKRRKKTGPKSLKNYEKGRFFFSFSQGCIRCYFFPNFLTKQIRVLNWVSKKGGSLFE